MFQLPVDNNVKKPARTEMGGGGERERGGGGLLTRKRVFCAHTLLVPFSASNPSGNSIFVIWQYNTWILSLKLHSICSKACHAIFDAWFICAILPSFLLQTFV